MATNVRLTLFPGVWVEMPLARYQHLMACLIDNLKQTPHGLLSKASHTDKETWRRQTELLAIQPIHDRPFNVFGMLFFSSLRQALIELRRMLISAAPEPTLLAGVPTTLLALFCDTQVFGEPVMSQLGMTNDDAMRLCSEMGRAIRLSLSGKEVGY